MPPDTPAGHSHTPFVTGLRHARCLFHPLREAAARCPHCGGTYCRECVTDEEGKLACPPCLRRLSRPLAPKESPVRLLRQIVAGIAIFMCITALSFALLHWRMNMPEQHLDFGHAFDNRQPEQSHE